MSPYELRFVQRDRLIFKSQNDKLLKDTPDFVDIYSFFAVSSKYDSLIKYILRVEAFGDCFAIKYYCSRAKHSDNKYSKILDFFNPGETLRILRTCAEVIPRILEEFPCASFVFVGARTHDHYDYLEGPEATQRYRIYTTLVQKLFGAEMFKIVVHPKESACILVNLIRYVDPRIGDEELFNRFALIFEI